jgi:hypothetical protein
VASIEFVNHASYIVDHGQIRLLCDPWLDGAAFDFGWDLLAETRFSYEQFHHITHIWFSHEHPDHFSPPNINRIPEKARADITVLYQNSIDHKVCNYCRKLGFKRVIEMNPGDWLHLDEKLAILCEPHDNGDSWLAIRSPQLSLLNLNDCVINTTRECRNILKKVGPVDVLATQFSYANWVGNVGDRVAMTAAARDKLEWVKTQVLTLTPKYVMPFASFTYFSHEDNYSLNEGMNKIDTVAEFIRSETRAEPVVLYPGDRWNLSNQSPPDCEYALRRYAEDYDRVQRDGFRHRSRQVTIEKLLEHGSAFVENFRVKNGALVNFLPSATIFLEDHGQSLILSSRGLRRASRDRNSCDLVCKSDALDYCFLSEFGGRTLDINGRFQVPKAGHYWKFKMYTTLANFNNRGEGLTEVVKIAYHRGRKKLCRLGC